MSRIVVDPEELRQLADALRRDAAEVQTLSTDLGSRVPQAGLTLLPAYGIHLPHLAERLMMLVGGPDGLLGIVAALLADAAVLDHEREVFLAVDAALAALRDGSLNDLLALFPDKILKAYVDLVDQGEKAAKLPLWVQHGRLGDMISEVGRYGLPAAAGVAFLGAWGDGTFWGDLAKAAGSSAFTLLPFFTGDMKRWWKGAQELKDAGKPGGLAGGKLGWLGLGLDAAAFGKDFFPPDGKPIDKVKAGLDGAQVAADIAMMSGWPPAMIGGAAATVAISGIDFYRNHHKEINKWVSDRAQDATEDAKILADGARDAAENVVDGAKDAAENVVDGAKDAAKKLADKLPF